jgi:hypothetical protein
LQTHAKDSTHRRLEAVRDLIHLLATQRAQAAMDAQEALHSDLPTAQSKQNYAKRLFARLRVQTTSTLTAVCGRDGTTYTDAKGMAAALAENWG